MAKTRKTHSLSPFVLVSFGYHSEEYPISAREAMDVYERTLQPGNVCTLFVRATNKPATVDDIRSTGGAS